MTSVDLFNKKKEKYSEAALIFTNSLGPEGEVDDIIIETPFPIDKRGFFDPLSLTPIRHGVVVLPGIKLLEVNVEHPKNCSYVILNTEALEKPKLKKVGAQDATGDTDLAI